MKFWKWPILTHVDRNHILFLKQTVWKFPPVSSDRKLSRREVRKTNMIHQSVLRADVIKCRPYGFYFSNRPSCASPEQSWPLLTPPTLYSASQLNMFSFPCQQNAMWKKKSRVWNIECNSKQKNVLFPPTVCRYHIFLIYRVIRLYIIM